MNDFREKLFETAMHDRTPAQLVGDLVSYGALPEHILQDLCEAWVTLQIDRYEGGIGERDE